MGIFSFFRSRPKGTAVTAKERLQVLIAHQNKTSEGPDYLPLLKKDILNVIKKYVEIGEEQVVVQLDSQEDCDVLELNITLPDDAVMVSKTPEEDADAKPDSDSKNPQKKQQRTKKTTAASGNKKRKSNNTNNRQKRKKPAATEESSD